MNNKEIEKVVLHNYKMIHNKIMIKFFSLENQIETLTKRVSELENRRAHEKQFSKTE